MTKIALPQKVCYIIESLEKAGYEAFAVGGCVRDTLLGRVPDDWDITTSAKPEEVKRVFNRTIDTGIQHGTVTVMLDREGFEVTTYRIDGEYEDSRHPKEVTYTTNLVEDLKRRDFTINAMAYNDRTGIVDEFGGMEDLEEKIIRCVGEPKERFTEDALRMMRAVRFSAQLGFNIDEKTSKAVKELAPTLSKISAERIQTEFVKLMMSDNPTYITKAYELGLTAIFLPELDLAFATPQNNPYHQYNVGEHCVVCLSHIKKDKALRIAALLHDFGKPLCRTTDDDDIDHFYGHAAKGEEVANTILRRLKFDTDTITKVRKYVKYHDDFIAPERESVRRAINKFGEEYALPIIELMIADNSSKSTLEQEERLERLGKIYDLYLDIIDKKECVSLRTLAISGNDLMELGIPKGKEIGVILNKLLDKVLSNPEHNTKEYLTSLAINIK